MKKKGFTLIELLAVIVVLAIIALIATPMVLNTIEKAREGAAKASAETYMRAIEEYVVKSQIDSSKPQLQAGVRYQLSSTKYEIASLENPQEIFINDLIDIKGDKPESGYVIVNKSGIVESMEMIMNSYLVACTSVTCEVAKTDTVYESYKVGDAVTIDGVGYHVTKTSTILDEYVTLLRDESIGTMQFDDTDVDYETSTLKTYLDTTYKATFGDMQKYIKEITLLEFGELNFSEPDENEYVTVELKGKEGTYTYILNNVEDNSWLTNNRFYTKSIYTDSYSCDEVVEATQECINPKYSYLYVGIENNMFAPKYEVGYYVANYLGNTYGKISAAGSGWSGDNVSINVRPVVEISKKALD